MKVNMIGVKTSNKRFMRVQGSDPSFTRAYFQCASSESSDESA